MKKTHLTHELCCELGRNTLMHHLNRSDKTPLRVYGVPRGGLCALALLTTDSIIGSVLRIVHHPMQADVILDDIIDSGETRDKHRCWDKPFVALIDKQLVQAHKDMGWVVFPWEKETGPEDAVVRLLEGIGENPKRNGLIETPKRVVKALAEMTAGYQQDPSEILSKVFDEEYDEMVILRDIEFVSLCEHHMLPFTGTVDVGYIPGKVVGLSKLARLVECFARRLQVQERLTKQIAEAIGTYLSAKGVAVVVRANHSCMACRGVKKPGAEMVTCSMLGVLRDDAKARAEFLSLCAKT